MSEPRPDDTLDTILAALTAFTANHREPEGLGDLFYTYSRDPLATYTDSPGYLRYLVHFHRDAHVKDFIGHIQALLSPIDTVVDVGCAAGFTGLYLAHRGQPVICHDFEGLGLAFIRHHAAACQLPVTVVTYGASLTQQPWALALDVLEHTGNHLGALRWFKEMGQHVALCYPLAGYLPPYAHLLNEYVDDEAIGWVLEKRYTLDYWARANGRRYAIYH